MLREERVPHALLFCGPEGAGKMALALALASQLLSGERLQDADADNFMTGEDPRVARNKAMLRQWAHPDLHFSYPTIKLPGMASDHQPVSKDFAKEWHAPIT